MNLLEIPKGSNILVDTNIFLYTRQKASEQCKQLLVRCERKEIKGYITPFIAAEFCHRRMIQEAQFLGLSTSNPAKTLSEKPENIKKLKVYADDTRALLGGDFESTQVETEDFSRALALQGTYGLLTIDSLNLAVALRLGLDGIASGDQAFKNIPGIACYMPTDLKRK